MSRLVGPSRRLVTPVLLVATFVAGMTIGPATVGAAATQVVNTFVTNTASNPLPVNGTINVGNLPTTQAVSGTVGLNSSANTVKIDSAANSVTVGNFPATQNVNVTGGSIAVAPKVSNDIESTGFHSVAQAQTDDLALGNGSGLNVTAISVNDGLSEQDSWRVVVIGSTFAMKVATGSGNLFLPLPQPLFVKTVSVQCLSANGCFWSIEVAGYAAP